MNSKKDSEGLDAMMNIWQQGQDAFFKAQEEAAEQFRKSLEGVSGMAGSTRNQADPFAAWQSLIGAWAPMWEPKKNPMSPDFSASFVNNKDMFFSLLDPQKWTNYAPEQLRVILEQIARGPQFADLATPQHSVADAWRESVDYQQAASDMSKVIQSAWTKA